MEKIIQESDGRQDTTVGNDHYIVAIGASAGGLEAIHEFFDNMPSNGNLSFVIIQHLSPDYKSLLVELVAKHTHMKVYEAKHGMQVEKNCIYVIPNNKLLSISGGKLQLSEKNFEKAPNTAIDTFLRSLAQDRGAKAIAVILSGTGTDGSRGIQAIQHAGGMVLVQDPISAKFDGMPNTAIASGFSDYILAPELMPEEIFNYIKERPVRVVGEDQPDETYLPEVLKLVERNCNYDFTNYKTPTILRRIGRRMAQLGVKKFNQYLDLLKKRPDECKLLGKEFLIGVTKFFRDRQAFQLLRDVVIEDIIKHKQEGEMIKVWVSACSTGEEAYSIAIYINDLLQEMEKSLEVKIFATDLDLDAIEFASKGIYPADSIAEIEDRLKSRYFIYEDGSVMVHPEIRKQIVFARHNILKDPPFIKNDLVSCRNMLIYMNNILQRKVIATLQFSLNTGGYLFLGPSEIPASGRDVFQEVNSKWKLYRKISNENAYNPERFPSTQNYKTSREVKFGHTRENHTQKELAEDFRTLLTDEYGFAAVYIDGNFEVKEAVGDYKKYLSLPDKSLHLQLLKMVNPDISIVLGNAIRKVFKEPGKISLHNLRMKGGENEKGVNVFVKPAGRDGLYLVAFSEGSEQITKSVSQFAIQGSSESAGYIAELEDELKETRSNLQMAIESLETANEELQSSNEELLSANEELQSSNEELQSLNEELHTLNTEHQLRIKELVELNDDLNNYFRSTEIAQLFVDNNLRIRKYNPAAVAMINMIETDLGRPIDHISTNIRNSNLVEDIKAVLAGTPIIEKEVVLLNGRFSIMKVIPYLKHDKEADGAVITFIDVSQLKNLDNIIKGVFNSSLSAIMAFKTVKNNSGEVEDFKWIAANYAADQLMEVENANYLGKSLKEQFPELLKKSLFDKLVKVSLSGKPYQAEVPLERKGETEWYQVVANQMMDGIVITFTNITEKKKTEEQLRVNYYELMKTKENYRRLNEELELKVEERTKELAESEERFRLVANATTDAIWDWDLASDVIWWSDSFYKHFGFDKEGPVIDIDFWRQQIHHEDRERVNNEILDIINNWGIFWSTKYRFRKANGEYAIILDRGAILRDVHGKPTRMVGSISDITQAEIAERLLKEKNDELEKLIEEFQFVTNFIPQMVWATDPKGNHNFFNKRWYDYTGLSYEETKDKGWSLTLHPDDYSRTWKEWSECLETGKDYEVEYRMRRYDGEYRWFLGRGMPLKDDDGKIIKWFGTCTDINDQKLMTTILEEKVKERTEELERTNQELEVSNNELLQFASVASHDLKEPLRKIHIFSNMIRDKYMAGMDGGAITYIDRIIHASARMTKLINDLLTFTRLTESSDYELTDLNLIVDEVLSDLELMISDKQAKISVSDLPKAEIVTGQMRQVFQNLISNALKFSKKNVLPEITVTGHLVDSCSFDANPSEDGEYCRIVIKDNGIGFDNQYSNKIFTIFQRLHSRETYDGTGIGLAISRKIIEKHNGIITAAGKENIGSEFTIILPLYQTTAVQVQ